MARPNITAFLMCRDLGHAWEEDSFPLKHRGRKVPWGQRRVLVCGRCGMDQLQLINVHGKVGSRHYDKPPGYEAVSGMKKTEARALRIKKMKERRKK